MAIKDGYEARPNLGQGPDQPTLSSIFVERAAGLMADPKQLQEIGNALPLLGYILRACGQGSECQIRYGDVEAACGCAHVTVKGWGQRLADLGYIEKRAAGPAGLHIRLITGKLPVADGIPPRVAEAIGSVGDLLNGIRSTIDGALSEGGHRVRECLADLQAIGGSA